MFSQDMDATFLFVVSINGHDGVRNPGRFYNSYTLPADWPIGATHVTRQGVSIFMRDSNGTYSTLQFIKAKSTIPLGMTGVDISVLGNSIENMILAMRDWKGYPSSAGEGPSGQVVLYYFNNTLKAWVEKDTIHNQLSSTSAWRNEDWFGKGIALSWNNRTDHIVAVIGAPRDAKQAYTYYVPRSAYIKPSLSNSNQWTSGPLVLNDDYRPRSSFFGGSMVFSPNGEFLLVSDAAGRKGRGKVSIYRRRDNMGAIDTKIFGLENEVAPPIDRSNVYDFFKLADLQKTSSLLFDPAKNDSTQKTSPPTDSEELYATDWFGLSIAANWWGVVVGDPVSECFYTYAMPQMCTRPLSFDSRTNH